MFLSGSVFVSFFDILFLPKSIVMQNWMIVPLRVAVIIYNANTRTTNSISRKLPQSFIYRIHFNFFWIKNIILLDKNKLLILNQL